MPAFLTGLGVDELSMSAQDIAPVKAALRGESRTAMEDLAQRALRPCYRRRGPRPMNP